MKYGNFVKTHKESGRYVLPYNNLKIEFKLYKPQIFFVDEYINKILKSATKYRYKKSHLSTFLNYALNYVAVRKILKKYKKIMRHKPQTSYRLPYLRYKMIKWYLKVLPNLKIQNIMDYIKAIPECLYLPTHCTSCKRLLLNSVYTNKRDMFICNTCYSTSQFQVLFTKFFNVYIINSKTLPPTSSNVANKPDESAFEIIV